ncbi:hypothetical protein L7F22_064520 [Adiantum nelumboides]|nr:hypothetical protein [Adiantum nelumboides]
MNHTRIQDTGNAGQWWTTLLLQGQAPSTWIYFKQIFASAWLSDDFEADVMTEWHQLNAATCKNLDDFNRKFWKVLLPVTSNRFVSLTEQIEKYCCGLPKGLRKYSTKTKVTTLTQLIEVANTGNGFLKEEDYEFNTGVREGSAKKYVLNEVPRPTQEPAKAWKGKAKAEPAKAPANKWKRPLPRSDSMADKGKDKLPVEESSSSTRRHRRETAAADTEFMASARTAARIARAPRPCMTAEEQEENNLFTAQLMSMMGTFEQLAKNPRMQKLLKTKDYRTGTGPARNGHRSNEHSTHPTIPMHTSFLGYFGGGSVFQSMIRPSPGFQGYMPSTDPRVAPAAENAGLRDEKNADLRDETNADLMAALAVENTDMMRLLWLKNADLRDEKSADLMVATVANAIKARSLIEKLPLVVLHCRRTSNGGTRSPRSQNIIDSWVNDNVLYSTPHGSNDDWYWLYAAVKCKSLLVTNDEMRDHLFELLGNNFFLKWKERHQVRFTFSPHGLELLMPPPYSTIIQESQGGNWHIPQSGADDVELSREWLCVTRSTKVSTELKPSITSEQKSDTVTISNVKEQTPSETLLKLEAAERVSMSTVTYDI